MNKSIAFPATFVKPPAYRLVACAAYPLHSRWRNHSGMVTKADIGKAVDRLRKGRKMTKRKLSIDADIDAGNLNRIISGKQEATLERLDKLAATLGVRVSDIIRMAETGQEEDPRKMAIIRLVEDMPVTDLDTVFRRPTDDCQESEAAARPRRRSGAH